MSNRTYLYIRKGMEHIYKKFREIAKREDRSPSQILLELIEEYVRLHEPGNPQRRLDTILAPGGKPVVNCRHFDKLYRGKVYCRLHSMWGPLSRCEKCLLHGG